MKVSTAQEWLRRWAKRYEKITGYDPEYNDLIKKHESFTAEDFRRIGKWKDGVTTEGRWRPNVASVAYIVWEQATKELPKCPDESRVEVFLKGWSNREYEDIFKNGPRKKHFGLSRASILLHFVSGGRYPIFDSRVRAAIARLLDRPQLADTTASYLTKFLPVFNELAESCDCKTTEELRMLDKALFAYGALDKSIFLELTATL
jgi:hypothetical protein